ncbi:SRPBCC family protein [Actinosynnema sp. NPDC020468]|uniref:SRPBCC family protein n=1 Tax=Actinosynnema sp. NPDC020468 TaxID=3154488 RepID=UPI0033F4E6C1
MADYEFEHSVETDASAAAVWGLWSDVRRWVEWDSSVESVSLDGEFVVGAVGRMVVEGQPPLVFSLIEVTEGESFTDETRVPGAVLRFGHRLAVVGGRLRVTHRVEIDGDAAGELGPLVTSDVPAAMDGLVGLASSAR